MSWVEWAIDNALLGVSEDAMIAIMRNADIEPMAAAAIAQNAKQIANRKSIKSLRQRVKKLESVMRNTQHLLEQNPNYTHVPRIKAQNAQDFLQNYWSAGKPAILAEFAKDWPAMSKWTIEYFRDTYGNQPIQIQTERDKDANYEINSVSHRTPSTMKAFAEKILAVESSNDFYMTANNRGVMKMPGILEDIGSLPEFINRPKPNDKWHLWMGPKGTLTPFHHDENALVHAQILGRKRWRLISPLNTPDVYNHRHVFSEVNLFDIDYDKFPLMKNVRILMATVEPGDALFLPIGWWHTVESLDRSISISITDVVYPNDWHFENPED